MSNPKIIFYLDRNRKDKTISAIQKSLQIFLQNHHPNHEICPNGKFSLGDIGFTWGIPCIYKSNTKNRMKIHQMYRNKKRPLLVYEKGFLKREIYYSIGWNSIVGFGYYNNTNMPSDRFEKLNITLSPHQPKTTGNILICGQIPWDSQVQHLPNYRKWVQQIVQQIRKHTNRPIVYRPHPKQNPKNSKAVLTLPNTIKSTKATLEEDFQEAFVVISYNSNSLVESLISGIPFFCFDRGSVVYDLANHDLTQIETPNFPDDKSRYQKLCDIAYSQWNTTEIESGEFWQHIKKGLKNSLLIENDSYFRNKLQKLW